MKEPKVVAGGEEPELARPGRVPDASARAATTAPIARSMPTVPPVSTFEVLDEKSVAPVLVKPAEIDETTSKDENATEIFSRATISELPQEPMLGDEPFDVESSMPRSEPAWWEDWMRVGHDLKARMLERSRRVPLLWTALATTGAVLVVSAIGLALWSGTRAEAVEPVAAIDRGVTAGTHHALMGDQAMPDVVIPKRVAAALEPSSDAKKPLPPLVYVEEVEKKAAEAHAAAIIPASTIETKSEPAKVELKAEARAEVKAAPKAAAKVESKEVAKADPKQAAKADAKQVAKAEPKQAAKAAPKLAAKVEAKPAAKPSREVKTKIALAPNARVLKTHVLRAPDRFVIDVAGQDKVPALPGSGGAIKSIRFGKHPDFARIVIETGAAIENGRASKQGKDLAVVLELR